MILLGSAPGVGTARAPLCHGKWPKSLDCLSQLLDHSIAL